MTIEATLYNVLQLLHLSLVGAGMEQHNNGALGQIPQIALRWQILIASINCRQRTKRATKKIIIITFIYWQLYLLTLWEDRGCNQLTHLNTWQVERRHSAKSGTSAELQYSSLD